VRILRAIPASNNLAVALWRRAEPSKSRRRACNLAIVPSVYPNNNIGCWPIDPIRCFAGGTVTLRILHLPPAKPLNRFVDSFDPVSTHP